LEGSVGHLAGVVLDLELQARALRAGGAEALRPRHRRLLAAAAAAATVGVFGRAAESVVGLAGRNCLVII
jgi:hypothetical protein